MKRALFLLTLVQPLAYTYYYSETLQSLNTGAWTQNGSVTVWSGLSAPDPEGGSLISLLGVPGADPREHEVKMTLSLPAAGGTYVSYLNATPDARLGATSATGSFYAVEISPGTVSATGGGSATVRVRKSIGGVVSDLAVTMAPCRNGTIVRSIYRSGGIWVYLDDVLYTYPADGEVPSGRPGLGAYATPTGGSVLNLNLGVREYVAPGAVDASKIASYVLPNEVQFQWKGTQDDPGGSGVYAYHIYRDGQWLGWTRSPDFVDATVAPGATYTYTFYADDFDQNWSAPTSVQVSTPPAGAIDPRRVGVRPTGAYWGAMGEQIDIFSGNLSVSVPLFKAMGRGGWSVPISLSYNSQIWRYHSNQNWLLGRDVGYGLGWRVMAGSLVPEWSDYYTVHHYTFTDASGAEYRLDVNTNGIWTSRQGIYVSYDAANERLYWPDGTFWVMRCVSSGLEDDGGTRYPTIVEDTNGNQVFIRYKTGLGSEYAADSSARIDYVQDVRGYSQSYPTYRFNYTNNRLTQINNTIYTAENYNFAYLTGQPLYSPFNSQPFGTVTLLQSLSNSIPHTHSFEYGGNTGEMTKVTFPYGGDLRWAYRSYNYFGGQMLREVQYRYLSKAVGATLNTYTFVRDDSGGAYHAWGVVQNAGGTGEKVWYFNSGGLQTAYEDRPAPGQTALRRQDFTWTQDAAGTPYIGTALTTLDPGTAYQAQSKTEQSLDIHGNVVWTKIYDYGNLSTPARTYNHTYVTHANYTSRFMFNRALTSTVTPAGGGPITLFSNSYDWNNANCGSPWTPPGPATPPADVDPAYNGVVFRGNVSYQTTPNGSVCNMYILGVVAGRVDGAGHLTTGATSAATKWAVPTAISGGGVTNSFTYTSFLGIASVTEANGSAAIFSYDSAARPQQTTSPHGATTYYSYNDTPSDPRSFAITNGHYVSTHYDGLGRTIKVERGDQTRGVQSVVDTEYDVCACSPVGKVKRVSQPYAPGGTIYWTTYNYDGLGRLLSVVAPDGASTGTYLYQGRTTTVTDPAGKWKKFTTGAMGNLVQVTEPNPAGGANLETYYTYDALNNLTQVSMPRNGYTQTRTFAYQGTLLTSSTNPENGTTTYTYYGDGKVATRTDAAGRRIEYTYDNYDRLKLERATKLQYGQWVEQARKEYQYDTNNIDPSVSEYAAGRLAATTDGNVTYIYGYTPAGLIKTKQLRYLEEPMTATWTYDDEGKVNTITYPSGSVFTYGYDSMGRPNTLSGRRYNQYQAQSLVTGTQYNAAGQLTQVNHSQDWQWTETRQYNANGQLMRLSGMVIDIEYRYTAGQNNGRIAQTKDWVSGEEVTYTYDSLNRLIGAVTTGPEWGNSYTYDGWGNLTAKTVTKGSAPAWSNAVDPATNHLVGQPYDAAGNNGYEFDSWNRLAPIDYYRNQPTYNYDAFNKRVGRLTGAYSSEEEVVFYGIDGRKLETFRRPISSNYAVPYSDDVYFAGTQIVAESRRVITDRLGSVRADITGQRYNYYPYGEERGSTPNGVTKFGTYFRDEATTDYADQRYYANNQGRFSTPDPYRASAGLADPGSWNRYAYVQGDPINGVDPRGLRVCREDDQFYLCGPADDYMNVDDDGLGNAVDGSGPPPGKESGGGGGGSPLAAMKARRNQYKDMIYASATGGIPGEVLDCLAGRESGWDPSADNGQGFRGMFQFGSLAWRDVNEITGATYAYLPNVFDAQISTVYAAAELEILLRREVGRARYASGDFSDNDITEVLKAYNGSSIAEAYAKQIMDCAKEMKAGRIDAALAAIGKN